MVVGHVAPEAAVGGPIALVADGDPVTVDPGRSCLRLDVPEEEFLRRQAAWRPRPPRTLRGVLAKYARQVSSASKGAVTD